MNNLDRADFIFNIVNDFCTNKNVENATLELISRICKEYKFGRISSFYNDKIAEQFKLLYNFNSENDNSENPENQFVPDVSIPEHSMMIAKKGSKREQHILDLFAESNIVYSKDFSSISNNLSILDFVQSEKQAKEFFLYAIIDAELGTLGYMVFERFDELCTSENSLREITTALNVVKIRIIESRKNKELHKKYKIKEAMSETSQLDRYLLVVEKESFEILYHNNCIDGVNENNRLYEKCHEVIYGRKNPCNDCPMFNIELNKAIYTSKDNFDYIVRVSEISWKVENDAYVISTINATQFIKNKMSNDILTDSLTWFGLKERIKSEYDEDDKYAYISVDIEGIKLINDEHSLVVGNEILKQLSITMKNFVQDGEYYSRVVADNYAVIIKYIDDENLNNRIEEFDQIISKMFRNVFSEINIVVTGGIYIINNDLYRHLDIAFENTRLARNTAKGSYKNTFVLYSDTLRKELKNNKYIEDKVEFALENDEFLVYLQPKFELTTNRIVGAEALVRWLSSSSSEMIYPDKFIPIFERNGFILTLDFIVYEKVFKFIRDCLDENLKIMPISINASRNHLREDDFVDRLLELFETYDVPKELIEIEITENASEDGDVQLNDFVEQLKSENISVSMDDFGSAYSSLNLLKTLDIDTLKLDKAFLDKVENQKLADLISKDEIIVKNIVNMANELHFNVICEGIETYEQVEFLKTIYCDYGQGYIFSKPIPLDEFREKYLLN